jgi:regulator of PEP synthase PpsR (kinase-PPPase family)
MRRMSDTATLSTIIDARVKDALIAFCKKRGIKMRYMIEQALIEQLEDEIDLEAYRERKDEEKFTLEEVMAGLEK